MPLVHALTVVARREPGQDRAAVFVRDGGLVIALADGAGGTSNGALAADAVIAAAERCAGDWVEALRAVDEDPRLGGGETTAVVLELDGSGIRGASVGDSEAWLVDGDTVDVLTHGQRRKPLLGGGAEPVAFDARALGTATLVVGSDGLFRYARRADIARIARERDLVAAVARLVALVRLPTGELQDDVSVVVVRGG
jgi:PPM family protein phosphatase